VSGRRFPGYDVLEQRRHWDEPTRAVVDARLRPSGARSFFSEAEEATCRALLQRLLGLDAGDAEIHVFEELDRRLALGMTDGFRYEDMPPDDEAWRVSLQELDRFARGRYGRDFHELEPGDQASLLCDLKGAECLGPLPVERLWSLWMRYACAAFYSHPDAWSEIGFGGPAYPRGYKNLGVDRREPWEVRDALPSADPLATKTALRPPSKSHPPGGSDREGTDGRGARQPSLLRADVRAPGA
jgi:hypothetical protein